MGATITAEVAGQNLLDELRQLLARHDGAQSPDEVRALADELSTALRRVRGRLTRLAKRDVESPGAPPEAQPAVQSSPDQVKPTPVKPPVATPPAVTRLPGDATSPTDDKPDMTTTAQDRRRRWLAVTVASVLLMILLLVVLAGCGQDRADPPTVEPMTTATTSIQILLATSSGDVCRNHDDQVGLWPAVSYTLRDGGGTIVATGTAVTDGALIGDRPAAIGRVVSLAPAYRCELDITIDAAPADHYELEISQDERRTTRTLSADDLARGPIEIELT